MKPFANIAVAVFSLVAAAHVLRIAMGWDVNIGGLAIPTWVSGVAIVVATMLAVMLWRESHPVEPE